MKKKIIATIIAVALLLTVCVTCISCTNKPTSDTTTIPTQKTTEPTTAKSTLNKEEVKATDTDETQSTKPTTKTEKVTQPATEKPTEKVTQPATEKPTARPTQKPTAKPTQPTTAKPTEPKKEWHEAVYRTVEHKAEYKKVWVVDKESYTYEEPVYELVFGSWSWDTGENISHLSQEELREFCKNQVLSGQSGSWYTGNKEVQTGTKTVTVPEEGHWEKELIKEAYTEKVLVKEAGYY